MIRGILMVCLLIPFAGMTQRPKQSNGIRFVTGLTWKQVQAKAKAEKKYIFMDCYATWCGPCKYMSEHIFTQAEVGKFMNDHFISVAVQVDQTSTDASDIRKWYADAKLISKQYAVSSLPAYLFFSPEGKPVHRVIGSTGEKGSAFVAKAKEALDPGKQYYALVGNYKDHLQDTAFLRLALSAALANDDRKNAQAIGNEYAKSLQNNYTPDAIRLLSNAIQSSGDVAFQLFLENPGRIDKLLNDEGAAEWAIVSVITNEAILPLFSENRGPLVWTDITRELKARYPGISSSVLHQLFMQFENQIKKLEITQRLYAKDAGPANWKEVADRINNKYPGYNADKMIAREKPAYYAFKKSWPECEQSALQYVERFENELSTSELNSIAWDYGFMHSTDTGFLLKSLQWSGRTLPSLSDTTAHHVNGDYANIDTYANLLYKLGRKEEAIAWEKKAYDLSLTFSWAIPDQNNLRLTLERMQQGKSTWEGRNERNDMYQ